MSSAKPKFYEFVASVWVNAPKLAMSECGYKPGDIEWESINLAEGANFNPEYLKITATGTVPALVVDGQTFNDSTTVTSEIIKRAPHPPPVAAHSSTSIIEEVHAAAHDPNATFVLSISDEDREAKAKSFLVQFLSGRQKALDKYAPDAPAEFKNFLEVKQKDNRGLLEFYTGNPSAAEREGHYGAAQQLWKSAGILIRGVITQALLKNPGPFATGAAPGEADFHIITWLARTISNTGVERSSPASVAIPKLQEYTGGHAFDPVISKYWDTWIKRDSFVSNNIH